MLYKVGRFLQFLGLIVLPAGIAGNLARPTEFTVGYTLIVSAAGMALFALGWLLQQAARRD